MSYDLVYCKFEINVLKKKMNSYIFYVPHIQVWTKYDATTVTCKMIGDPVKIWEKNKCSFTCSYQLQVRE